MRVHENVWVGKIGDRGREVERAFRGYLDEDEKDGIGLGFGGRRVEMEVEHVDRVKMYAPGVVHCVFDVRISCDN